MAKKSRAQRKQNREDKINLFYRTMREALHADIGFDAKAFIDRLPKEDRGAALLAERTLYKHLREEEQAV